MAFETSQYEKHDVSSFIYEPVWSNDGSSIDFKIVYASDIFARDWRRIYHNDNYLGAHLKKDTLMDEYTLSMLTEFQSEKPYPFVSYIPMVDLHLYFEPIPNLPAPYAGFYITNITNYASQEARDHFLQKQHILSSRRQDVGDVPCQSDNRQFGRSQRQRPLRFGFDSVFVFGFDETTCGAFSDSIGAHEVFTALSDIIAFITERECNSKKVEETLTSKILAEQFDMVAYLTNEQYGVTIGEAAKVKQGSIFPTTAGGNYQHYLEGRVYPVLSGNDEQKKEMAESLSLETVKRQLKSKEPYVANISIEIDGEIYYKQFDFYSIDPKADFYILLKNDTTEIQKQHISMNEQLHMALEAANQANVAKTAFLSSMSHEIRTPMNAIIGLGSIALKDPNLPDRTRDYLEKIGASAKHLLGLINDILDMSRIESGRLTIKNEEFSFSDMLEQINTMVSSQCRDRGLKYKCRVIGHVDDYYIGDNMKLKQVIINILGNAVKFTPVPGTVSFTVKCTAEFEGQSMFQFTMADTGIGMDKEYLPKIFEAFSQENEGSSNKYGSTGLGMAITKNIVELMNGNISVESEKGVGTTFTVNVTLRNSERKNMETDHAENGQIAVEMFSSSEINQYDAILMDVRMPVMDGLKATEAIRSLDRPDAKTVPIIAMTANAFDEDVQRSLQVGMNAHLSKPVEPERLYATLGELIGD